MRRPRKVDPPRNSTELAPLGRGPLIDKLIAAIRAAAEGISSSDLAQQLDLNAADSKIAGQLLSRLEGTGILRRHGRHFRWADSSRVLFGKIRQTRRKTISFIPEDILERSRGRIRVAPEDTRGAFDGDRVVASVSRHSGTAEATVQQIVERGKLHVVGRVHRGFRHVWVESLDEKFPFDVDLDERSSKDLDDGWIVVVEVTSYPAGRANAVGSVVERLGKSSDEAGMDIEIVIHKHDLPTRFPEEVIHEVEHVPPEVPESAISGRLDLRDVATVTIDGETARDFDDAISLERLDNGTFELGVHIADVSHYVTPGSALEVEARLRGTSVYFPERAIPMLPEELSNGICSLNPGVDRLTMSAMMTVDRKGSVVGCDLRESVIKSRERMTYTDVNRLLSQPDDALTKRYAPLMHLFHVMKDLANILIRMREQRGAIDFNLPESVFEFDDEGRIEGVQRAERNIAHRIIEEFMLLANETVAGHLARLVPSIFRIHEEPQPQRVIEFAELAAAYGYKFPSAGVSSTDYQRLSRQLDGKPEERVMIFAMLRSLERAKYSAHNAGHFGLAAPVYTHFTSPIRRYPDLVVHRILRGVLKRGKGAALPLRELETIAEESSERERVADAAERELEEWRKAVLMSERVGEEFDALIINVRDFGFFVELDELFVEGLVAVATLGDDYYLFDERRHTLTGQKRRRVYKLGDRLRVRLDRVNVDRHLLDFKAVTSDE